MASSIALTLKAQRACVFCRDRKQTCDKLLPKCSRCASKDRHCDYSLIKPPQRDDGLTSLSSTNREPVAKIHRPCGCLEVSEDGELRCLRAIGHRGRACHNSAGHDLGLDRLVRTILEVEGGNIETFVESFLDIIPRWFPIISMSDIFDAAGKLREVRDDCDQDHWPILLLSMRLMMQSYCSRPGHHPEESSLYLLTRQLFLVSQDRPPSSTLLQAGLFIVAYEWGHGLSRSSYLTLNSCVALARVMRYDKDLATSLSGVQGADWWTNPAVRCWSAVVLLDRMIALSSIDCSFPLLVPPPPDTSFDASVQQLQARLAESKLDDHKNWSFEATAAVAELTGEALTLAPSYSSISAERLEIATSRTEKLVELLLGISQVEPFLTCVMTPLAISALVSARLECAINSHKINQNPQSQDQLRSAFNMALESIRLTPEQMSGPSVSRLSLVMLCAIFRSALHFVWYFRSEIPAPDFAKLRSGLLMLRERWGIGNLYLKELDKMISQPGTC